MLLLLACLSALAAAPGPEPAPSTAAAVDGLPGPVEVLLFYPPDSEAGRLVRAYYDALARESRLSVEVVDVALEPLLAEELGVRDNGTIVLRGNGRVFVERVAVGGEIALLDETTRYGLGRLGRTRRDVGMVGGAALTSLRVALDPADGAVVDVRDGIVPETVALLVVAGPVPEADARRIGAWMETGGRLLMLAEPGDRGQAELGKRLGVRIGEAPIAEGPRRAFPMLRVQYLRAFSQAGTARSGLVLAAPGAVALDELPVDALVLGRAAEGAWIDLDEDGEADPGEARGPFPVVVGLSGQAEAGGDWRAVVFGCAGAFTDIAMEKAVGNVYALTESLAWLKADPEPRPTPGPDPYGLVERGPVPLFDAPWPVDHVLLTSGGLEMEIERRNDAHGSYVWVTTPRRSFVGNGYAAGLLERPLVAIREAPTAGDPEDFSLDVVWARMSVGGVEIELGGPLPGTSDRFVRRGDRMFLVDRATVLRFESRGGGWSDDRLVPVTPYTLDGIVVSSGGAETRLFGKERPLTDKERAWVKAALALEAAPLDGPLPKLVRVLTYEVVTRDDRWRVELLREEGGNRYFARSDWQRAVVRVTGSPATVAEF